MVATPVLMHTTTVDTPTGIMFQIQFINSPTCTELRKQRRQRVKETNNSEWYIGGSKKD